MLSIALPEMLMPEPSALPAVLAGPVLRRLEPTRMVFWLVGSQVLHPTLSLHCPGITPDLDCQVIAIGRQAFVHLIDIRLDSPLPCDVQIDYDLLLQTGNGAKGIAQWAPHLLYDGARQPSFVLHSRLEQLLHGSCRKPHHPAADGLHCADRLLMECTDPKARPALLMMSGDQVYADDVAGPMLRAIHALIERLGLFDEALQGAVVDNGTALYQHPASYYHRADLLPALESNETLRERFFGGARKPIFTSSNADNHLVTFAEVMAMYLLVWSPVPWSLIDPQMPSGLTVQRQDRYRQEQQLIGAFASGLGGVARVLAHVPSLMIFDDNPN